MRSGSEAFFQVAVVLIPAFLFGGAMRRPDQGRRPGSVVGVGIVVVLLGSVVAEVLAIRGVIDPAVNRSEQFFVVAVIVVGTVLIGALTAWSWLGDSVRDVPTGGTARQSGEIRGAISTKKKIGWGALTFCVAACAVAFSADEITDSLDNVDARNDLARAGQQVQRTSTALARADQSVSSTRALLIGTLVEMQPRTREDLAALVERQIHAIDKVVQPVLRTKRPSTATIASAEEALDAPTSRLSKPFYRDLGTSRADPEMHLAALAVDRFVRAEMVRLATKKTSARAQQRHVKACSEVASGSAKAPPGCPKSEA